jgi:hypothetical protein
MGRRAGGLWSGPTHLAQPKLRYCYSPHAVLVEVDWGKDTKPVNALDKILFAQRKTDWLKARVKDAACLEIFK